MKDIKMISYKKEKSGMDLINEIMKSVEVFVKDWDDNNLETKFLYRGQANSQWELIPGLFRLEKRDIDFESNMIHFLKAKKFVENEDELLVSIDAQHYSFPTRLLDVSYNLLNALFFACEKSKNKEILKNGVLYIIKVKLQRPATSENLHTIYKEIIENSDFFEKMSVDEKYLFVERINQNSRIVAQDGGLIVFLENKPLEKDKYKKIIIDYRNKDLILECLDKYFNINNGNMYPDMENNRDTYVKLASQQSFSKKSDWDLTKEIIKEYINNNLQLINKNYNNKEDRARELRRLKRRLNLMVEEFEGVKKETAYKKYIRYEIEKIDSEIKKIDIKADEKIIIEITVSKEDDFS